MTSGVRLLLAAALLALAVAATSLSSGAFTATSANPGSTFTASSTFPSACTPGTVQLTASEDSHVVENSATTATGGGSTTLRVVSRARANVNAADRNERTLVKFALPARAGCSIASASLSMTGSGQTDAGRTIQAYSVATSWSEATVTWSNAPQPVGAFATAASAASPSWTVTTLIQSQFTGAATAVGFLLKDQAENGANHVQQYRSSEATTPQPTLTVTFG
jgi:hypothetical protein